jgi:mono/diheme cytochrome c family protein
MKQPVLILSFLLVVPALLAGQPNAAADAGALLFRDKGCVHCHDAGGVGTQKGPSLTGLHADKRWTPAKIRSQILNGGQKMPPFGDSVSDEEVEELVAYLRADHPREKEKPAPQPSR